MASLLIKMTKWYGNGSRAVCMSFFIISAKSSKNQFHNIMAIIVEGKRQKSMSYDDICLFAHSPV